MSYQPLFPSYRGVLLKLSLLTAECL